MSMGTESRSCEQARERASLRLDGELSDLESAFVEAHIRRCAGCRAYAAECEAIALRLRSAELAWLERPTSLPRVRPRRARHAAQASVAAALVAIAAGFGTLYGAAGSEPRQSTFAVPKNAALPAFDSSPQGLPTTREAALSQKPPAPIPRSLALPDV